jgi:hypothetical protein
MTNRTASQTITSANYTIVGNKIYNATAVVWDGVNVTYSYTYDANNTATDVMYDASSSISSVTDWYPIFIVIGAMVVLILLTVIIITAIRSSGMVGGTSQAGANSVGTA